MTILYRWHWTLKRKFEMNDLLLLVWGHATCLDDWNILQMGGVSTQKGNLWICLLKLMMEMKSLHIVNLFPKLSCSSPLSLEIPHYTQGLSSQEPLTEGPTRNLHRQVLILSLWYELWCRLSDCKFIVFMKGKLIKRQCMSRCSGSNCQSNQKDCLTGDKF